MSKSEQGNSVKYQRSRNKGLYNGYPGLEFWISWFRVLGTGFKKKNDKHSFMHLEKDYLHKIKKVVGNVLETNKQTKMRNVYLHGHYLSS